MPAVLRSLRPRIKKPANPQADPRYQKVITQLKQKTEQTKKHPTAKQKAAESAAAAKGPPNEKRAGAQGNQVDKIKEAPTGKPEPTSFLALLRAEIEKAMPKTLGDTEKFMKGGDAGSLKSSLEGNVSQQADKAAGGVDSATKAQPSEGGVATKQVKAIPGEPAPPSPQVAGGEGMPAPKSQDEVSLQDSKQDTEQAMKDAEVTTPQMQKANDPRFSSVLSSKEAVGKQADAAPAQFRTKETAVLTATASKATADSKKTAMGMVSTKGSSKTKVLSKQNEAKAKDEAARKKVADDIEAIYNQTKTNVETKLNSLDEEVNSIFDAGIESALSQMKSYVEDKIFDYKLRRYLSIPLVGQARWIKDQFMGLPDEVNKYYVDGRNLFTRIMDALVVRVATLVEKRLAEAKAEVAKGQARIKTYVAGLSPDLKKVGLAAEKEVSGKFKELEQSIDDKKNQLAQSLAQKYKEGFDKADAALKAIQDANKGLVQAFIEKLGEIIKIIAEFKDKLMGILRKGWETIKLILADPIGFLGNLIAAIKQGIGQFVGNIWTHLRKGFMEWLFGALSGAGIEIPSDLSLGSIFKLVLSVLGLTTQRLEQEAVKLLGPTAVAVIKKLIEYVGAFVQGGPKAIWEKVKQDIGDLKAMVIDAIQDWLISTLIKKATAKMLMMFNPAGAFVQACIMIYDTVMWVVQNASRIMAFVEAIINSVHAIATGAIGGAANWIEQSLARMIPLVIGFLAGLIGLGGISQKIREFITKVQDKVWAAIRKALKKIVDTVKKLVKFAAKGAAAVVGALRSITGPRGVKLTKVAQGVTAEVQKTRSGATLYQKGRGSGPALVQSILQDNPKAKFDNASGTLVLPSISAGALEAPTLSAIAQKLGQATGATRITLNKSGGGWALDAHINPTLARLASYSAGAGNPLQPLLDDIKKEENRIHPQKETLMAVCREAANRHGATVTFAWNPREGRLDVKFTVAGSAPPVEFSTYIVTVPDPHEICPACQTNRGETSPHNVIPGSMWSKAIQFGLGQVGISQPYDAWAQDILSAGTSTTYNARLSLATTEDAQCRACEINQDRGAQPHSAIQRRRGAAKFKITPRPGTPAPAGVSNKTMFVGRQFGASSAGAGLTDAQLMELTKLKIEQVLGTINTRLTLRTTGTTGARPTTSPVYTNIVGAGRIGVFLEHIRKSILARATAARGRASYR